MYSILINIPLHCTALLIHCSTTQLIFFSEDQWCHTLYYLLLLYSSLHLGIRLQHHKRSSNCLHSQDVSLHLNHRECRVSFPGVFTNHGEQSLRTTLITVPCRTNGVELGAPVDLRLIPLQSVLVLKETARFHYAACVRVEKSERALILLSGWLFV